jgi:iron complex transport system ATP-binding protein
MTAPLVARELSLSVAGKRLVDRVSLELACGELTVLLGPNGAGKSTLLRALLGELAPEAGAVELLGKNLKGYRALERARLVTLVPQEQPADFPLTVAELVELGRLPHAALGSARHDDRAAIARSIERADLGRLLQRDVGSLSGGERQRASLARALAQDTPVLLLDEPTAHLDIGHQLAVLELVRERVDAGTAALVALHDLGLAARFADRLLLLEDGRITACGTPAEVLTRAELARAFGVEAAIEHDEHGAIRHLTVLARTSAKETAC